MSLSSSKRGEKYLCPEVILRTALLKFHENLFDAWELELPLRVNLWSKTSPAVASVAVFSQDYGQSCTEGRTHCVPSYVTTAPLI